MQSDLLDHVHTAIITLDNELRFLSLNSSAESLLDLSCQRVAGLSLASVFYQQELQQDSVRALAQKQRLTRRETTLRLTNATVAVDYSVTPLPLTDSALLIEIHPRERIRRITRETSQTTEHETSRGFARTLAHEIKNPLGGIRGAAQLLERELTDPTHFDYTRIIIEESDRLSHLVDRILGPRTPPRIKNINIHETIERAASLVETETKFKLKIIRDYDPSIPQLPADRELIIQAILNLTRNAMQAIAENMPLSKGRITLKSRVIRQFTLSNKCQKMVCQISVIDNGPGIPDHLQDSIFYPMISGQPSGTGLGLPMTQTIVRQHNGLIEWNSQSSGATFHIYLPMTV